METQKYEEQYTLKTLINQYIEYKDEVFKYKWIIIISCIPFFAWHCYKYISTPVIYPSNLTFMVNDDEGGNMGGLTGLLGSFGLGNPGENNYERILFLSKSQRILRSVLLTQKEVGGLNDYLGNHLIRIHKIQEKKWAKPSDGGSLNLTKFLFSRDSVDIFTATELAALKSLTSILLGGKNDPPLFYTNLNEDTGIMTLSFDGQSEDLSVVFLETIFNKLSEFYVEKSIEKNQNTFTIIQKKVDSIRMALSRTEYQSASFDDRNKNLTLELNKVPVQRFSRDKQILMIMYGEAVKNMELAEFALKSNTPYIQLIDEPIRPIKAVKPSKKDLLLKSILFGLITGIIFVLVRKTIREALI